MAYDEGMAERIRYFLQDHPDVDERKMFGGLCLMVRGHMCLGVESENLMVRVGPEQYEEALQRPHARKMDFTGKPLKGFIYVAPEGFDADEDLQAWVDLALAFNRTLNAK